MAINPRSRRLAQGFTLIEILVVVAIIALLAAILLPVFARARDRARMTTCASNLRQIGQASLLYAQDNNGYFPSVTPPGPTCVWADSLTSYIKDDQIFWCPNLPTGEFHAGCPPFISGIPRYEGSYDLNAMQPAGFAVHDSKFTHPATTILALDGVGHFVFPANGTIPDSNFLLTEGVQVRHNGGDNVCFADGHVKWLRLESMVNRTMWLASD